MRQRGGADQLQQQGQISNLNYCKSCLDTGVHYRMAFFRRESPSPTLSPFVDLGAVNQSASVSGPHVELVLDLGDGIVMTLRRAS